MSVSPIPAEFPSPSNHSYCPTRTPSSASNASTKQVRVLFASTSVLGSISTEKISGFVFGITILVSKVAPSSKPSLGVM